MPASIISICNLALSHCGGFSIGALDEQSVEARLCSRHYEVCRDEVLRIFRWPSPRIKAARPGADVISNWEYVYAYPGLPGSRDLHEGSNPRVDAPGDTVISSTQDVKDLLSTRRRVPGVHGTDHGPASFDASWSAFIRLPADLITASP